MCQSGTHHNCLYIYLFRFCEGDRSHGDVLQAECLFRQLGYDVCSRFCSAQNGCCGVGNAGVCFGSILATWGKTSFHHSSYDFHHGVDDFAHSLRLCGKSRFRLWLFRRSGQTFKRRNLGKEYRIAFTMRIYDISAPTYAPSHLRAQSVDHLNVCVLLYIVSWPLFSALQATRL